MARKATVNFGANRRPKKTGGKKAKSGKGKGGKSQAWRKYVSNAPIPD